MKHIERKLDWMWDIIIGVSVNLKKLSEKADHPTNHLVKEIRTQVESAERILADLIKSHKKHKEEHRKAKKE
jgi:polyhydroxyalkanoate synthesis regulator phasin